LERTCNWTRSSKSQHSQWITHQEDTKTKAKQADYGVGNESDEAVDGIKDTTEHSADKAAVVLKCSCDNALSILVIHATVYLVFIVEV
jgi:hypothetical protein